MKQKRGQISFEYLSIVAFGMLVLLMAVYLFYGYSANSNDTFIVSRVEETGNTILNNAHNLYYSTGKGSSIILELNLPENVKNIYFLNNTDVSELVIEYNLRRGNTESVFFSPISLQGICPYTKLGKTTLFNALDEFHVGTLKVKITNIDGGVMISEVT
jgi:uncharacterized protein (UPF0333 family)